MSLRCVLRFTRNHFFFSSFSVTRNVGQWFILDSSLFLIWHSFSQQVLGLSCCSISGILPFSPFLCHWLGHWNRLPLCLCSSSSLIHAPLQPRDLPNDRHYWCSLAKNSVPTNAFWIKYILHSKKYFWVFLFLTCFSGAFFSATIFLSPILLIYFTNSKEPTLPLDSSNLCPRSYLLLCYTINAWLFLGLLNACEAPWRPKPILLFEFTVPTMFSEQMTRHFGEKQKQRKRRT